MLHLRQGRSRLADDLLLRGMFAARKAVFVDLLGWDVPVIDDLYEVDQFDTASAVYLVLSDAHGGHLASARLLPTTQPHILGDLFPALCEAPAPRADDVFEITRFCLDRRLRARDRRAARNSLVVALADYARRHNIAAYTAIAEFSWVQQILSFGWRCEPLGFPTNIRGEILTAFRIDIDSETEGLLAGAGIVAAASHLDEPALLAA